MHHFVWRKENPSTLLLGRDIGTTTMKYNMEVPLKHEHLKQMQHCKSTTVQFNSVTQSCPTLWDAMDCSMPGLPVHHQLPEFTHTHVHWVGDAIQSSHPRLCPSSPIFNLSQHESFPMSQFFASGGQSIGVSTSTSVLTMNIQDWFPWLYQINYTPA